MNFGATRLARFPSSSRHAVGCCMSASRPFKRPSSLQSLVVPYLHAAEYTLPGPLFFSLVRRMIAMLINCVAESTPADPPNPTDDVILSVAFSPDGTKIVSGSAGGTIKVWDTVNFRPHVESEWETFDKTNITAEDEVYTCFWRNKITGQEKWEKPSGGKRLPWNPRRSKSGIRVRRELKIAPPRPKLTLVGFSGRRAGAVEREDQSPQRLDQVGRVFPGRAQDSLWSGGQEDQNLGFGCTSRAQIRPSLAKTDACWLVRQARWSC